MVQTTTENEEEDPEEHQNRQQEINAFASMAAGGTSYSGTFESSSFPSYANTPQEASDSILTDDDDDDKNSEDELMISTSTIAAEEESFNMADEETYKNDTSFAAADESSFTSTYYSPGASGAAEEATRALFTAQANAGVVAPTGTFSLQDVQGGVDEGGASVAARQSNLEAAAAALFSDESGCDNASGSSPTSSSGHPSQSVSLPLHAYTSIPGAATRTTSNGMIMQPFPRTPMQSQKVTLHKPLFFGPHLPPYILEEARTIVRNAYRDLEADDSNKNDDGESQNIRKSTNQLPGPVRNLISTIRTYGHGVSILPGEDHKEATPYVSVYCPKWSEPTEVTSSPEEEGNNNNANAEGGIGGGLRERSDSAATLGSATSFDGGGGGSTGSIGGSVQKAPLHSSTADKNDIQLITSPTRAAEASSSASEIVRSDLSERDLFSMWARGGSGTAASISDDLSQASNGSHNNINNNNNSPDRPSRVIDRDASLGSFSSSVENKPILPMSDQKLFTQWVRGESSTTTIANTTSSLASSAASLERPATVSIRSSSANSMSSLGTQQMLFSDSSINNAAPSKTGTGNFFAANSGTFLSVPREEESDDDSVVGSEMKKKVGMSEHLNAALESLENEIPTSGSACGNTNDDDDSTEQPILRRIPLTRDGGRVLTNHELMNGVTPLFGEDDPPLPCEADLELYHHGEEQQRSKEQKRNQAIIATCCPKNIFGPLACPTTALSPDDNHSWNSRAVSSRWPMMRPSENGALPPPNSPKTPPRQDSPPRRRSVSPSNSGQRPTHSKRRSPVSFNQRNSDGRTRYGWWSESEEEDFDVFNVAVNESMESDDQDVPPDNDLPELVLPPWDHAAFNVRTQTHLEPKAELLHKQNKSLIHLHPATALAESMPFLCDRPPSFRYLQIDTQAVGFPDLGADIEPFFCTMAVYHVETAQQRNNDPNLAPIPELKRCGKVTESLNFDVVSNNDIEERCFNALWPYKSSLSSEDKSYQGTRCGVFPLPPNSNMHNLYAIITVSKVISEGPDFEIYLQQPQQDSSNGGSVDLDNLKAKAAKASQQQGRYTMPFAFGVAPLLQVFGGEVPTVASSRAVKIPLFRFSSGQGDRQIIDHIMVMLYPRANHRACGITGPAPVTNGGTAMLVMRNFGYLGLHSVVHSKSTLARDRLVDFTGDRQLRRKEEGDNEDGFQTISSENGIVVPNWQHSFVTEATTGGGRNPSQSDESSTTSSISGSLLYAQELAPLPLRAAPANKLQPEATDPRGRSRTNEEDVDAFFHTTFCNQLMCSPRQLSHSPKGNIIMKVEVRDMEWNEEHGIFLAHLPSSGPCVHNTRRGSFLVQETYTSCSARCIDPLFLDEFKIKLPLLLRPTTAKGKARIPAIMFTVFRLSFSTRKKWSKKIRRRQDRNSEDIAGDLTGELKEDMEASKSCHLIQLGCGYLSLALEHTVVASGSHQVDLMYSARHPRVEAKKKMSIPAGTLIVSELEGPKNGKPDGSRGGGDDSVPGDTESVGSGRGMSDTASATSATDSVARSEKTVERRLRHLRQTEADFLSLEVRVAVQSSVHSQNSILQEFLCQEPDSCTISKSAFEEFAKASRKEILEKSLADPLTEADDASYDAKNLLISAVDVSQHSLCATSEVSSHLLRVVPQLMKVAAYGTGDFNAVWANPASLIPLRLHALATLFQVLNTSVLYLSKRGVTQVDGRTKWNFKVLAGILAVIFNEETLFGVQAKETYDEEVLQSSKTADSNDKTKETRNRRRHVRSTFEFLNNGSNVEGSSASENLPVQTTNVEEPNDTESDVRDRSLSTESPTNPAASQEQKIDSVTDFQSALVAGATTADDESLFETATTTGATAAKSMINAFSGSSGGGRRWMTAPHPGLATIREDGVDTDFRVDTGTAGVHRPHPIGPLDALDTELIVHPSTKTVKQMRVPELKKKESSSDGQEAEHNSDLDTSLVDDETATDGQSAPFQSTGFGLISVEAPASSPKSRRQKSRKLRSQTLPTSDADIELAGTSFLDAIEKSLGLGMGGIASTVEEKRVGQAHHKKTRSRCSIDWSIPNDDLSSMFEDSSPQKRTVASHVSPESEVDETMVLLKEERAKCLQIPDFADRVKLAATKSIDQSRWFPFVYELLIEQWATMLKEYRELQNRRFQATTVATSGSTCALADSVSRSSTSIVACAPLIFEVIKQSLGWRVGRIQERLETLNQSPTGAAPLISLDEQLLSNLEHIVGLLAEACLDSQHFEAWDTRQRSIDVNDSIVLLIRDLFGFLDPANVHRVASVYLSRLSSSDGKQGQDRDTAIGLKCSQEITKLKLNAISAFIRFPDFLKVNSPQMLNWTASLVGAPALSTVVFFDSVLDRYMNTGSSWVEASRMKPHWLVDFVLETCVFGTENAEQNIQMRAASLLFELFWEQNQQASRIGNSSVVASMFISFLEKILLRTGYISRCFAPKSPVRQDIVRCVLFILQSAPQSLMRALWRRLSARSPGKNDSQRYGAIEQTVLLDSGSEHMTNESDRNSSRASMDLQEPDIFVMFSLLNVCLGTLDYEGADENSDLEGSRDNTNMVTTWNREFILSRELETSDVVQRRKLMSAFGRPGENPSEEGESEYTSTGSRKWFAHDGSIVVINATEQIVRELRFVLEPSEEAQSFFNPARRKVIRQKHRYQSSFTSIGSKESCASSTDGINFSYGDMVIFVRGATSIHLHALAVRLSDTALVKVLNASIEIIKIFGIKIFSEAVGETMQHWMRLVLFHCGSRRAEVRVPAADFLGFLLRSTWDSFGSFFRVRLPLLAVQTEVMERIVAKALFRHYRDQRKTNQNIELFSNGSAEASLTPLWRTLDRLHHQSASQNVAFRSALIRLAEKMKKLFRAYIAVHALKCLDNAGVLNADPTREVPRRSLDVETLIRAGRISMQRVINASAGYSKQFLGVHSTSLAQTAVAHSEAVEDAFLDAADVFSPTELPDHRVAWLKRLAKFHSARSKYAEEATCRYQIHLTLMSASKLHGSLWSSNPFQPWTKGISDGIHLDEGNPTGVSDFDDLDDYGPQFDESNDWVRRILYRNENSINLGGGDLDAGYRKCAFSGISLPAEYHTVGAWSTLRAMEMHMLEEAELAGELFLRAGIAASSRYAWGLATRFYAAKFNYGKLAHVYGRLARTVISQIPPIDPTLSEACVTVPLGRFYRVWFHGGAPDELIGEEFVYRTASNVTLEEFGKELKEVIRSIILDNTPIHLVLDGHSEEKAQSSVSGFRITDNMEPVRVKVTPIRPMVRKSRRIRGLPEWFKEYVENAFTSPSTKINGIGDGGIPARRINYNDSGQFGDGISQRHGLSRSSTYGRRGHGAGPARVPGPQNNNGRLNFEAAYEGELVGADRFSFTQPINKDGSRGSRDWMKGEPGDFKKKSLRVIQLQVRQTFPACISRQTVVDRVVFTQAPLEAAIDSMCQWCSILFRSAIATNGQIVLGTRKDPGIGFEAAKVVSDCIHSSRVKQIGAFLLESKSSLDQEEDMDGMQRFEVLSDEEMSSLQVKLARSVLVFMELLHLLIARNRDLLLDVIQERKMFGRKTASSSSRVDYGSSQGELRTRSIPGRPNSIESFSAHDASKSRDTPDQSHRKQKSNASTIVDDSPPPPPPLPPPQPLHQSQENRARTDSAIGVQSELQRAFVSLARELYPKLSKALPRGETPRWIKNCCQEHYFSKYVYRQSPITMADIVIFEDLDLEIPSTPLIGRATDAFSRSTADAPMSRSYAASRASPDSPGGSLGSNSVLSRGSEAGRSSVRSSRTHRSQDKSLLASV